MRTIAIAMTLLATLPPLAGCEGAGGTRSGAAPEITRVTYRSWQESIDANLAARTLTRSRTEYEYASPTSGTPSSASTISEPPVTLDTERAAELAGVVRDSGFLALEDAYGAAEGARHYPYRITVHLADGTRKEVLFRSDPEHETRPEAFATLEEFPLGLSGE